MCSLENVRVFVDQRLAAFAEEMFEVIERTMREFEEQLRRQQDLKLLTAAFQPQVRIHRTDVQQLTLSEDVPPEQQQRSISLKQEEAPELPNFKEEEEEPGTGPMSTQLPVTVKVKEEQEDDPQPTQLPPRDHINDAAFDEDSGDGEGLDDDVNPEPDPVHCSSGWEDPVEHQSGFILQQNTQTPLVNGEHSGGGTSAGSTDLQGNLVQVPTEENPSSFGGNRQNLERTNKKQKPRRHVGSERYTCLICNKTFTCKVSIERHMAVHIVEKPLRCSLGGTSSTTREGFQTDLRPRNPEAGNQVPTEGNPLPQQNLERTQTEPSRTKGEEQLMPIKAELSPDLEQDQPPQLPQVKDEQEDVGTSQEGEQLGGLEQAQGIQVTLPLVPVKSEGDENRQKPNVQQLTLSEDVPPEQQQRSISLKQEEAPELPHFKEEEEEEEEPGTGPTSTQLPVTVKVKEDHEEEPDPEPDPGTCSWLEHQSGLDSEEYGGGGTSAGSSDPWGIRVHVPPEENPSSSGSRGRSVGSGGTFRCRLNVEAHTAARSGPTPLGAGSSFQAPVQRRTSERPFSCSFCKRRFGSKANMLSHKKIHALQEPLCCPVCAKSFPHKAGLTQHLQVHAARDQFPCSFCEKSFKSKRLLNMHSVLHSREKPFPCSFCGQRFRRKYTLNQHMHRHRDARPFSCSVCGKVFAAKNYLGRHMMLHTGEKPFGCSQCGKAFAMKNYLDQHVVLHAAERPFRCGECGKCFARKTLLMQHRYRHTGERPFSCPECHKTFLSKKNVMRHMLIHQREAMSSSVPEDTSPTAQS
ncbi:uncharacterized protein V6R79_023942 [Siganus canaliculatus]